MARIEHRREITTPLSPVDAHAHLLAAFAARNASMAQVSGNYLEGRTGSQAAIRLKGGWLAKLEDFPVVAAVAIAPAGSGAVVRLTVADDLGFGVKTGMKKKYTQAVEHFAAQLAGSLAGPTTARGACPAGHPVSPAARFCASCGTPLAPTAPGA